MRRLSTLSMVIIAAVVQSVPLSAFGFSGADFSVGKSLKVARMGCEAVTLANGKVVVFGGHGVNFVSLASAEVYNPATDSFVAVTSNYTHDYSDIARLNDGRYLLAGGSSDLGVPAYKTAEIFDTASLSFSITGQMPILRSGGGATTLSNGNVLIAGGWYTWSAAYSIAALYNTQNGTFDTIGHVKVPRAYPLVVATSDGKAVVFGGIDYTTGAIGPKDVELFDPITDSFSVLMNNPFGADSGWYAGNLYGNRDLSAQRLKDGKYLFMATMTDSNPILYTFDPGSKAFTRVSVTPALPKGLSIWSPIVDTARGKAYLIASPTQADDTVRLGLISVDLTNWTYDTLDSWYTVHTAPLYPGGLSFSLLKDGRILLSGFNTQAGSNTNFSPTTLTLMITPTPNNPTKAVGLNLCRAQDALTADIRGRTIIVSSRTSVGIELFSLNGRSIRTAQLNCGATFAIDNAIRAGAYIVRIVGHGESLVKAIMLR